MLLTIVATFVVIVAHALFIPFGSARYTPAQGWIALSGLYASAAAAQFMNDAGSIIFSTLTASAMAFLVALVSGAAKQQHTIWPHALVAITMPIVTLTWHDPGFAVAVTMVWMLLSELGNWRIAHEPGWRVPLGYFLLMSYAGVTMWATENHTPITWALPICWLVYGAVNLLISLQRWNTQSLEAVDERADEIMAAADTPIDAEA